MATKLKSAKFTIVVAWTEVDSEFVRENARDLGERPTMREITVAKAATWLLNADEAELAKAKASAFILANGWSIFCYPTAERDPLGRARAAILKGAK